MSISSFDMIFDKRFFMKVPYSLTKYLSSEELILLFYLVDWASFMGKRDEPFFCRMKQIMEELNISVSTQTRQMRSLSKKGYIKLSKRGMPPVRWIEINWDLIREQCEELYPSVMKIREVRKKHFKVKSKFERNGNAWNGDDDEPFDEE